MNLIRVAPETAFISARDYSGKIYDGTKAIADLTLRVDDGSHAVEVVFVNGKSFDRLSGLNETAVGEPLAITGFPVLSAPFDRARGADTDCQATFQFDPNGKPANQVEKMFGTIKTTMGQAMNFEVKSSDFEQSTLKAFSGQQLPPEPTPPHDGGSPERQRP